MSKRLTPPFESLVKSWDYKVPEGFVPSDRVYRWSGVPDDPRFESLRLPDGWNSLVDLFNWARRNPRRLLQLPKQWKSPRVIDRVSTWVDIPSIEGRPAFSARAVKALKDILERDGVLLPLRCPGRKFHLFVPRPRSDLLDLKRSKLEHDRYTREKVFSVERHVFHKERLKDVGIFCIDREPLKVYVTDAFVTRVKETGLLGAHFEIVFPLRAKDDWRSLAWRANERYRRDASINGQRLLSKCITVKFLTQYPHEATTAQQDARLQRWARWAGDQLRDRTSKLPPVGISTGGHTQDTGGFLVEFQGQDVIKLLPLVRAMIPKAKWRGTVLISGRGVARQEMVFT